MTRDSDSVIIVGGGGFLGQAVTKLLAERKMRATVFDLPHAIKTPRAKNITAHAIDIRNREKLLRLANEIPRGAWVVNLAARQYQDAPPRRARQNWFSDINENGALNVCHFAREISAAGLVQFSTDMVYGMPRAVPVEENHPCHPIGEYGISKMRMETQVREFACAGGFPATIFRSRLIAGAGRLGVFVKLFELIRRNRPLPLIGAGQNFYQMVALEDCADAVLRALDSGCPNQTYNLGSTPRLCVRDLMMQLCREAGSKSKVIPTPASLVRATLRALALIGVEPLYREQYLLADKHFIVSTERARRDLGWQPARDDLAMLVEAYRHWEKLRAS